MKEQFGQAVLVIILLCASVALVSSMSGWLDFRHSIESFSSSTPTAKGPDQSPSNSTSAQPPPEQKVQEPQVPEPKTTAKGPDQLSSNSISAQPPPEQKAPVPKAIEPSAGPQTIAVKPPGPEAKPSQQAILETGYDQLKGLGREAVGYGLYSYGVLTAASPRSAAFLGEIFKSIPPIGDTAAVRAQLNIFYIPTKNDKVTDLAALVEASRNDQTKMAVRYSEAMYDYKMARAILNHVCNLPAKAMTSLCKGPMSGGPYILANARPASSLEPVPPPFLFVDLSDINPHAYPEFISAFRAVVKQEDVTDDAKLHSLRLKVLNLVLTAADWTPKAKRSVVDILHSFDSSPDGQASR